MNEAKKISNDELNRIIENIKNNYLSNTKMPKLVIGSGLSIVYGVPGMKELSDRLSEYFKQCGNKEIIQLWESRSEAIKTKGLEEGLASITKSEEILVKEIKKVTSEFILKKEIELFDEIFNAETGFKKFMKYLKKTCSVNNRLLDVMTPNYDRIIEIVCESLDMIIISGFNGHIRGTFNNEILKRPKGKYILNNENYMYVRLFKPHGSLNWVKINDIIYQTNDNSLIMENINNIEIITPGGSKFEIGMTSTEFRCVRECFNETLSPGLYSLFIYGYGFNDEHFNNVLYGCFKEQNTLILSRSIKEEIIDKALLNDKMVIFYSNDSKNYMIYKSQKYEIEYEFWDINIFSREFIS